MIGHQFYVQKTSPVHSLNFWTKVSCLLLFLPLSGFLGSTRLLILVAAVSTILILLSNVGIKTLWNAARLYLILTVLGLAVLQIAFHEEDTLSLVVLNGLILCLRFVLLISLGILFSMTTSPMEFTFGLMRAGLPHYYGITVMVAFRMLPMVGQKIQNVVDAQRARGARIELRLQTLPVLPYRFAALVIPVLHSTLETSVGFAEVLISRGYDLKRPITLPPDSLKATDVGLFVASFILFGLAIFKVI